MLRRTGYILGLLFVVACVAAYPLTWGRIVSIAYVTEQGRHGSVGVVNGQIELGVGWERMPFKPGWSAERSRFGWWSAQLWKVKLQL